MGVNYCDVFWANPKTEMNAIDAVQGGTPDKLFEVDLSDFRGKPEAVRDSSGSILINTARDPEKELRCVSPRLSSHQV